MTPSKAGTVFRELMQTADEELAMFSRRSGLQAASSAEDLLKARELLQAVGDALESGTGRDWDKVRASWAGLRTKQDPFHAAAGGSAEPPKPPMMQRFVVAKPSLGDLAPGAAGQAAEAKAKFVPVAKPKFIPGAPGAPPIAPPMPPMPPMPPAPPVPAAEPLPPPAEAYAPAVPSPWAPGAAQPEAAGPAGPSSPWGGSVGAPSPYGVASPQPPERSGDPFGFGAPPPEPEWQQPALPPPPMLAPLAPGAEPVGVAGPFTRAQPVAQPQAGLPFAKPPAAGAPQPAAYPAPAPAAEQPAAAPAAQPPPPPRRRAAAAAAPAAGAPTTPGAALATLDQSAGSVLHSVAKYAAFCAACAEFPDRLAHTMTGYGVPSEPARAALDQQWQDRFDEEPDLLAKWEELFQSFRTSLRVTG